jgi:CheY-like chemotaxis protein
VTQKTILLVDDDADFVTVLTARCESIGLVVKHAYNLLTATMMVANSAPDIVCVDVELPTGSGLAFCESLATDPATTHLPIIVLTGRSTLTILETCKKVHADYVVKTGSYWLTLEPLLRQLVTATVPSVERPPKLSRNENRLDDSVSPSPKTLMVAPSTMPNSKQIVVADDDEDILKLMTRRLSSLGCAVFGVDNALDAINLIHRIMPDLVCLDVGMPSGNGLSICEMMASEERLRKIPIIILTGRSDESTIRRCHDMLVYYVQKSSDTWNRIEPLVRELLQIDAPATVTGPAPQSSCLTVTATESTIASTSPMDNRNDLLDAVFAALGAESKDQESNHVCDDVSCEAPDAEDVPWVLSIDDDVDFSDVLKIRLEQHGVAVRRAFNGMEGFRLAFKAPASAILLDYNMPNGQGDYILGRLKDNPVTVDIPVIIITGAKDKVLERRMLAMGAAAFFEKPVSMDRLRDELAKHIDILDFAKKSLPINAPDNAFRPKLSMVSSE